MGKREYLLSMLMELPPKLEAIEEELKKQEYTSEEVTLTACRFAENCCCECIEFEYSFGRKPSPEEIHSSYIYQICELLLKYGLKPNLVLGECFALTNIMHELRYVDNGYIGPKTIRVLLENGGDPHIVIDGETLFDEVEYNVLFDIVYYGAGFEDGDNFYRQFSIWLLMIGYGAVTCKQKCPIDILNNYPVEQFKNFENFRCEIEYLEKDWTMHIIDKEKNIEVARL